MRSRKGFTLTEMLLTLFLLCMLTLLVLPYRQSTGQSYDCFPDQYLYLQSDALRRAEDTDYEDPLGELFLPIHFNGSGNVDLARTLPFTVRGYERIVIELGGGRLVFYE